MLEAPAAFSVPIRLGRAPSEARVGTFVVGLCGRKSFGDASKGLLQVDPHPDRVMQRIKRHRSIASLGTIFVWIVVPTSRFWFRLFYQQHRIVSVIASVGRPENCSAGGGVTWTPAEGGGGGWRNGVPCRALCFVSERMLAPKAQEHKFWPEKVFSTNNFPPPHI